MGLKGSIGGTIRVNKMNMLIAVIGGVVIAVQIWVVHLHRFGFVHPLSAGGSNEKWQ
jgi:hypothetical protein